MTSKLEAIESSALDMPFIELLVPSELFKLFSACLISNSSFIIVPLYLVLYMPRRHYDLDEVLALAESGKCAAEIIEDLQLSVGERAIQKTVNKFLGPRPTRAPAVEDDPLRRRVVAWMVANGLDDHFCLQCEKWSAWACSIRQLKRDDDLGSLVFVCRHCAAPGDR